VKIDVSDITDNILNDAEITNELLIELTAKTTLDAQADLMKATPVDTGEARGGWEAITPTEPYQEGVIENNVEHIVYLNDGHSDQAPEGFVENIVQRYNHGG